MYGRVCTHGVLDYYDEADWCFTEDVIQKAYHDTYFVAAQRDMCLASG